MLGRHPEGRDAAILGHSLAGLSIRPAERFEPASLDRRPPSPAGQGTLQTAQPIVARSPVLGPAASTGQPIQRLLDVDLQKVPLSLRKSLAASVSRFNQYRDRDRNTQKALHTQFRSVDSIERLVNRHLRDNSDALTGAQRLELFGLLRQTQDHHVDLTARNVQHGHDLWLRDEASLSRKQKGRVQALWKSLVSRKGNLRIESEDPAFRSRTLAGFAHLLQGAHGRDLLGELNRNQGGGPERRVIVSDSHAATYQGVNKQADPGSWAEGIAHALRDEDRHTRLAHGANVGTGSFVQIAAQQPAALDDYESDASGKPLFAPEFITLGHELGHARHNLRGTTATGGWFDGDPLEGQELDRRLWSNPEEYANITREENPLRAEHGLPARRYHATIRSARSTRHRHDLETRVEQLWNTVPAEHRRTFGPASFGPLNQALQNTDLSVPDNARALTERVGRLERELPGRIWREQVKASFWSALKPTKAKALGLAGAALGGLWLWNRQGNE